LQLEYLAPMIANGWSSPIVTVREPDDSTVCIGAVLI
jgi:hypothetical protein